MGSRWVIEDPSSASAVALAKACPNLQDTLRDLAESDPEPSASLAAREALWRLGHAKIFVPELLQRLALSELPDERAGAARILGGMGSAAAEFAVHLAKALHDDDWPGRRLGAFGAKSVVPHAAALAELLHDDAPEVRAAAARAVGEGGAAVWTSPGELPAAAARRRRRRAQVVTR